MARIENVEEVDGSARTRILIAAEKLFACNGLYATTMRQVATESAVGIHLVNYHFKSKEDLYGEVLSRLAPDINFRRQDLLDELELRYAPDTPPVEEVVRAIIQPILDIRRVDPERHANIVKIYYREIGTPLWANTVGDHLFPTLKRSAALLQRCLPTVSRGDVTLLLAVIFRNLILLSPAEARAMVGPDLAAKWDENAIDDRLIKALAGAVRAFV